MINDFNFPYMRNNPTFCSTVSEESLYEGSDRLLKADGSTNIHNNP